MVGNQAKLSAGGKDFEYPVLSGTVGPDVVDIRKLYGQTGHVHLRSGLYLDGKLRKRADLHRR